MATLGTNRPYSVGDIFNILYENVGTDAALRVFKPGGVPTVIHSFTTAGSGAGGTATSTSITSLQHFQNIAVYADVTFSQGAATNTLILLVDARLNGTDFVNVARFTDITTAGQAIVHLTKQRTNSEVIFAGDAGAGTVRAVGFGDAVRVRRQITGTATTQFTATVYITNQVV